MAGRAAAAGSGCVRPGAPELGTATQPEPGHLDRVELLWACIALFDGDWSTAALDLPAVYAPRPPNLYRVGDAQDRVRQLLRDAAPTVVVSLADFLPPNERSGRPTAQPEPPARIRHRSAWTSTLMACLEMTKQGELVVEQLDDAVMPAFRGQQLTNDLFRLVMLASHLVTLRSASGPHISGGPLLRGQVTGARFEAVASAFLAIDVPSRQAGPAAVDEGIAPTARHRRRHTERARRRAHVLTSCEAQDRITLALT